MCVSRRCESYRAGSGPQAGAEGAGRGGRPAARACHAHNSFHPSVVDGEWLFVLLRTGVFEASLRVMEKCTHYLSLLSSFSNFPLCHSQFIKVDRQSQYVQGYRLFYRPSGGTWILQDINSPSERSTVLTNLLKGTEYEIKIRPYFDEFQGKDSRTLLVRTPEEGNKSSATCLYQKEIERKPLLIN